MLQQLVIKILLGKISIQSKQRSVFLGCIRKDRGGEAILCLCLILCHFALGYLIILRGGEIVSQTVLCHRAVHIGFGKIGIEIYGFCIILYGIVIPSKLHKEPCAVKIGKHIVGVYCNNPVIIVQSIVVITYLRPYYSSVVEC